MRTDSLPAEVLLIAEKSRWSGLAAAFVRRLRPDARVLFWERGDPPPEELLASWKGGLLLSFKSDLVLPAEFLARAEVALNFHPAPPRYRGLGGYHLALTNGDATFGATCHHLAERIDFGPIVAVESFPIPPGCSLRRLKDRAAVSCLLLLRAMVRRLARGEPLPASTEVWGERLHTHRELEQLLAELQGRPRSPAWLALPAEIPPAAQAAAAARFGTPLYLYDLDRLERQWRELRRELPRRVAIHYALKANSNPRLCHFLRELGAGAECASEGELRRALAAGFAPGAILLIGPAKSAALLAFAVRAGVGTVILESVAEARRLEKAAARLGRRQPVLLRIHPLERPRRGEIAVARGPSKFGVDEEHAATALAEISALPHLDLEGLHVYTESNLMDAGEMLASVDDTLQLADRLASQGFPMSRVDFGGGLGVPYDAAQKPFDLPAFARGLEQRLAGRRQRFLFEIGRYLVAESGAYLCRVVEVKTSRGRRIAIVDGGIHHLYRPLMSRANLFLELLRPDGAGSFARPEGEPEPWTLAGLLPTPADVLAEAAPLPPLREGDLVVIRNCGAYAFEHCLAGFTLQARPAEAACRSGRLSLIRRRGSLDDSLLGHDLAAADIKETGMNETSFNEPALTESRT